MTTSPTRHKHLHLKRKKIAYVGHLIILCTSTVNGFQLLTNAINCAVLNIAIVVDTTLN